MNTFLKKELITNHHPELVSGSKDYGFRIKSGMTPCDEGGRSMVEMLGVLAIIGVISVGGVSAYTSAMRQHRANELLNEASKRAAIVAMQLASGKVAPTPADKTLITEFTDPAGYGFSVGKNPANDKQFNMEITGVTKEVCEKIRTMATGNIRGISDCPTGETGTLTLTFNNDLSATVQASDYKTEDECKSPFTWCSGLGTNGQCIEGNDCCAGITTSDCLLCNTSTGEITKPGKTQTCDYDGGTDNGQCDGNGGCVEKKEFYMGTGHGRWVQVNALSESERCPQGGHWATLEDVQKELGCTTVNTTCTSWFDINTGADLWLATPSGEGYAYYMATSSYKLQAGSIDSAYHKKSILCIKAP